VSAKSRYCNEGEDFKKKKKKRESVAWAQNEGKENLSMERDQREWGERRLFWVPSRRD
jgi:hypothetical protein